ncbi:MAG: hypothetical protein JWQ96_3310 [Segetibacter sp.]|nr:hypothetical protein [Segetibacter sp.]
MEVTTKNSGKIVRSNVIRYGLELNKTQNLYDAQTNHGLKEREQNSWEGFIKKALSNESLDAGIVLK